jgi:glycosyltransferase involved in cell wall biosynthesis
VARKILYVAYHFPPVGGGGVQRNSKFVRYLREFGYESVVLSGSGAGEDHWTPVDTTLRTDIPDGIQVIRIPGSEPAGKSGWPRRIERILDRPSGPARWWTSGIVRASEHVESDIEAIYGSLVPYDTATAVAEIARRLDKPWVADLQDPWALDEMWIYPSALHRRRDLRRMREVLGTAAAIVMNTPEAVRRVQRAFPELADKVIVSIPNGYDAADFAADPPPTRASDRFRIVHTGYLHTEEGLRLRRVRHLRRIAGGTAMPVDVLTRSHVYLLDAIRLLVKEDPGLVDVLDVQLAGVLTPVDRRVAADLPFVHFPGYLSHAETVALLRSAELLFLPMQELAPGTRAGLVPGKTYEYLASGRPILAAIPDGDARDILGAAGNALLCRPSDVEGIAAALRARIADWRSGRDVPAPDPAVVRRFERATLTGQLAGVFDSVLAASSDGSVISGARPRTARRVAG